MSANRANTRNHILDISICISIIRAFQFVFAIVLLALSAYGISKYAYDGFGLTLFTSLATVIITVYILVAAEFYSLIYNYWAILGLDIFLIIFWLISFSVTASNGASYFWVNRYYFNDKNYNSITYRNVLRATAVFRAIEFLIFIVTLIFTGVYLHRHRAVGGHCLPHLNTAETVEMKNRRQGTSYTQPAPVQEVPLASV